MFSEQGEAMRARGIAKPATCGSKFRSKGAGAVAKDGLAAKIHHAPQVNRHDSNQQQELPR
ncbi:hypothetical protein A9R05_04230 [Burkholderia sp. KK1]|nr:hypothetical protein A9R05_04230 [Burkholderia sp. KK1]